MRINSPFVTHTITQKKMHSSVTVDVVLNKMGGGEKSIIVKHYSFDVSATNNADKMQREA